MPDQLGFGSPEWETLRIRSWHLPLADPRLSRWCVVLVVAWFRPPQPGVKGGRRPSRQRSRSDP
jgi:hypothetical protein